MKDKGFVDSSLECYWSFAKILGALHESGASRTVLAVTLLVALCVSLFSQNRSFRPCHLLPSFSVESLDLSGAFVSESATKLLYEE